MSKLTLELLRRYSNSVPNSKEALSYLNKIDTTFTEQELLLESLTEAVSILQLLDKKEKITIKSKKGEINIFIGKVPSRKTKK